MGILLACFFVIFVPFAWENVFSQVLKKPRVGQKTFSLPPAALDGKISLEKAMQKRRTVRELGRGRISLNQISQILWAAQGITNSEGFRTSPSAGALFPLEVRIVNGNVQGIPAGTFRYSPEKNELVQESDTDIRRELAIAALDQAWINENSVLVVISAVVARCSIKYGERGLRYCFLEAGHAAQNILLQAAAMDLETGLVGAFDDSLVQKLINMETGEQPIYLIPIGAKN